MAPKNSCLQRKNIIKITFIVGILFLFAVLTDFPFIDAVINKNISDTFPVMDNILQTDFMTNYGNMTSYIKVFQVSDDRTVYNLFGISYIEVDINKNELKFCLNIGVGTGNVLSIYWASRSIAYWLGYDWRLITDLENECFRWNENLSPEGTEDLVLRRMDLTFINKEQFTSFLPKRSKFEVNKNISKEQLYNIQHWIFNTLSSHNDKYCIIWAHECQLLFMFYNPYFVTKFIIPEINHALKARMSWDYHYMNIFNDMSKTNDIVIHFRCGDIISLNWKNPEYGFHTITYYKMIMEFFSNHFKWKLTQHSTVWILTQLKKDKMWEMKIYDMVKCEQLINGFVHSEQFQSIFEPANTVILGGQTVTNDFYRMVNAPLLICSPSTFCLHAALGKPYDIGYSVIPSFGPWIDLHEIIKKKDMIDIRHSDKGLNMVQSKLLPKNHIIIDTKQKNDIMVNVKEMIERNMTQSMDVLLDYLLTH